MLALSTQFTYVHEPFNVNYPHALSSVNSDRWYTYVTETSNPAHRESIQQAFSLRYPISQEVRNVEGLGQLKAVARNFLRYALDRWAGRAVLMKDPLALLSAEWIAQECGVDVLVMIRHPAAFAGSLKVKGWTFPFEDLLNQPQLIEDHFEDHVDDIEAFAENEYDVVDQAALLWTLLYSVVRKYQNRHPEWIYLRHEDVAQNPLSTFESLYDTFGLDFTDSIRQEVEAHSRSSGGEDALHRDSSAVIQNWTERLTASEIERVRHRTEPVASHFYSEDDW
jgi:hypothetical protein